MTTFSFEETKSFSEHIDNENSHSTKSFEPEKENSDSSEIQARGFLSPVSGEQLKEFPI